MCRESENQRIREERERERALKYGGSDRSVAPRWGSRPRAADGTRVCLCLSVLCIHHGSPGGGGGRPPPRGNSYFGECRTGTMRSPNGSRPRVGQRPGESRPRGVNPGHLDPGAEGSSCLIALRASFVKLPPPPPSQRAVVVLSKRLQFATTN